jgi:2-methylcitrate dehydratase PrpD
MGNTISKLARFTYEASFSDLPEEVVHEMKRVLLDSIGCAIAGLLSERGKIAVELAKKLNGPPESTILGTKHKVSSANGAFANGELMNALDFDALSPQVVHIVPILIPAVLAMAESVSASGKDLILATALGLEIPVRLKPSTDQNPADSSDKGPRPLPPVTGYSVVTLAAAAGASKILNQGQETTAHAISTAGCMSPPNLFHKFIDTSPVRMTKYGSTGWGAQAGVTSALLADIGYTGDTNLFEGEFGFWRFTGQETWRTEELPAELGKEWLGHHLKYKLYPCGGVLSGVLDRFIEIVHENDYKPSDIEEIVAQPLAIVQNRLWQENKLETADDYAFDLLYLLACAAHRINPVRWQDREIRQDPGIKEFMERIAFRMVIDENDSYRARLADPRSFQMRIEVTAKGKTFKEKIPFVKGSWEPEEFRMTDDALIKKFTENAQRVLPSKKVDQLIRMLFELENIDNIAQMMETVTP